MTIVSFKHSPEEINTLMGVPCDNSWRIGEIRAKTIIKEKDNGWVLNSGLKVTSSLDEHIEALLKKLVPLSSKIQSLSKENYVEISCSIYASEPPALHFGKDVISQINKLGANLDIDLYMV